MKHWLILLWITLPIESFSTLVFPLPFERIVSNIQSAYLVEVVDTSISYSYETNTKCDITYISAKIVRIKYIKLLNWLTQCDIDCCEKMRLDTFTTVFIEKYPILFLDCRLNTYSIEVPWTGIEGNLELGKRYNFYFSDSYEKELYRAEIPEVSIYNTSILRYNKTFKFIELRNSEIYHSIKTFEFDESDGIYFLSKGDSCVHYFSKIFNIHETFVIHDKFIVEETNKIIYNTKDVVLYKNDEFLLRILIDDFKINVR